MALSILWLLLVSLGGIWHADWTRAVAESLVAQSLFAKLAYQSCIVLSIAAFLVYLLHVGSVGRRWIQTPSLLLRLAIDLGIGWLVTAFLCCFLLVFGYMKPIPLALGLLLIGLPSLPRSRDLGEDCKAAGQAFFRILSTLPFLTSLVSVYILAKLVSSLIPQNHGDPLYYHLASAWRYAEAGKLGFYDWMPWFLQGGFAEYLYAGLAVFSGDRFTLLILAQVFHATMTHVGAGIVVYGLARRSMESVFAVLAVLAFVTFAEGGDIFVTAKNDGYVLYFSLASLWLACDSLDRKDVKGLALAFCLAAFSFSIKFTGAFFILPFSAWLLWAAWPQWKVAPGLWIKGLFYLAPLVLLLTSINLIRNAIYAQNPFFPAMPSLFKSPYMDSEMAELVKSFTYVPGTLWEIISSQLRQTLFAKYIFFAAVGALFFKRYRSLGLFLIGCLCLLMLVTGQGQFVRFYSYVYGILAVLSLGVITTIAGRWMGTRALSLLLLLVILSDSKIELPMVALSKRWLPFLSSGDSYAEDFAKHKGNFSVHRWINQHRPREKVLGFLDNDSFFLDGALSVPEIELRAGAAAKSQTPQELAGRMHEGGFQLLQVPGFLKDYKPLFLLEHEDFPKCFELLQTFPSGYKIFALKQEAASC